MPGRPAGGAARRPALTAPGRRGSPGRTARCRCSPRSASASRSSARSRGVRIAACLHVTAETANLVRALLAGGAEVSLCAANPLSTQDDVARRACRRAGRGGLRRARRGPRGLRASAARARRRARRRSSIDDGAELIVCAHREGGGAAAALLGATEETATGLVRLRAMAAEGTLRCPVLAVNETLTERIFNDRYGTGQSTLDGILRATNLLLAGRTVVVLGYGSAGRGVAQRAKGAGAAVIVCEVDPVARSRRGWRASR